MRRLLLHELGQGGVEEGLGIHPFEQIFHSEPQSPVSPGGIRPSCEAKAKTRAGRLPSTARPGSELAAGICLHPLALTHPTLICSNHRALKCACRLVFQQKLRGDAPERKAGPGGGEEGPRSSRPGVREGALGASLCRAPGTPPLG